ncbi:uncharacterized protein LOC114533250 [Dendronephthya gigantea]|uniref:uncharacterized protein LOC114533250 n=1 Tax=Dendronephthya gigantea TaxID=151771 RepID=UPI0010693038|nr:uncharacterized protein LOC114533250 [Dendronephthya gigantea]
MATFKQARDLLLVSYYHKHITAEQLFVLLEENTLHNPEFNYGQYERFDLESILEPECRSNFRFDKADIPVLADVLGLPETFHCDQGTVARKLEAICILLRRLAFPCRYADMIQLFGRPVPELCMITNKILDFIYERHGHRLTEWNENLMNPENLQIYADTVYRKGAALSNCFGFVDGTVRPICRPIALQRFVYNGHKRTHAIKFQSVTLPNGIIANMFGPVEGKKHDAGMLADSGLLNDLENHAFSADGEPMCIYGDPAYPLRVHLQAPFRGAVMTPAMEEFNRSMSTVRVSVEWAFGEVVRSFKCLDFKSNLKLGLSCVGKMYLVSAIIQNALSCLYGNITSTFFDLNPPTIQEYFS